MKEKEYLKNIKELIESDIVLVKKNRIYEENHRLNTYFNIGKLIVECQGKERRAKYGNELIKKWSKELTELYGKGYDTSAYEENKEVMRYAFSDVVDTKCTFGDDYSHCYDSREVNTYSSGSVKTFDGGGNCIVESSGYFVCNSGVGG